MEFKFQRCASAKCTSPNSTGRRTSNHCKPTLLDARVETQHKAKSFPTVVFWPIGGTNPAHSLRILLIRAGIETNPGPPHKQASGPPCEACGAKIRYTKSGKLTSHFVCAEKGCTVACHLHDPCSLIPRASRIKIKWYCNNHRTPVSPSHPNLQQRRPLTPCNELCPICHIKLKANPLQCTICNRKIHQAEACSGLPHRYAVKKARPTWKCHSCVAPQTNGDTEPPSPPPPTPPSPPSTPRSSRPVLGSQSPPKRCLYCKGIVHRGYLTCKGECKRHAHQSCCKELDTRDAKRKAVKNNDWECNTCLVKQRLPDEAPDSTDAISQKSEPKSRTKLNRPLRILQWNAEGVNPKMSELRCFMDEYKIDIALIQESKLMPKRNSPVLKGYSVIRGDRIGAEFPGGGLLTVVKEDLVYKENGHCNRAGVELLSVCIHLSGKKWLTINNLYLPPKGQADLSWIPVNPDSLFAGDLNGHSKIWDDTQPTDDRGEHIVDWMLNNNLNCINDGTPTRINRGTGGLSSPDVTCVTQGLNTKMKWTVIEETTMGSDHSPIVMELKNSDIQTISTTPLKTRWKSKGVNWVDFREEVEEAFPYDHSHLSESERIAVFNDVLIEAGKRNVGKTKPSRVKFAMNPKVRTLVKKRNFLRKQVKTRRTEWLEAEKEVRHAREEAKQEAWSEFVEELQVDDDASKVWRMVKSMDGTPTSSAPNEALVHQGKTIVTNKSKADAFAKHYAKVSTLNFTAEEREQNLKAKRAINAASVDDESCCPFSMRELKAAIRRMKRRGAPGADDIPPSFLKELGPKALTELLEIFNASFNHANIPQLWRHAIIIPLLKAGKSASEIESFRPISLTSCVVKALERMIADRLYTMAENRNWLVTQQAGFRKSRCCEDQVIKLTQMISDGFQQRKPQRAVMALLDYSKAYDRTWRERLLLKISELGAPQQIIRWISAFLRTRTAEVNINNTLSKRVRMKQGLPQGSVLSPLLFLLYINDIGKDVPEEVEHLLFADDASLVALDNDINAANDKLQIAVSAVQQWSVVNKLDLNLKKSCTFFFTTDSHQAKWRPNIKLFGEQMKYGDGPKEKCPKFLGVTLDRSLCFQDHVKSVTEKVDNRRKMLYCLASRSWGWKKHNLRRIYIAMHRSIMDYAAPAWQPWLSETAFNKLEVAQNNCLKIITGVYRNSNIECRRIEADIPSYRTHSNQLVATAHEKGLRLPSDHPRREAIENSKTPHRTKTRSSFREVGQRLSRSLSISNAPRRPIDVHFPEPWKKCDRNWSIHTNEDVKSDIPALKDRIESLNAEVTIYTDGSCTGGTSDGGAAAVITDGPYDNPNKIATLEQKGSKYTCSYEEEKRALHLGIQWLSTAQRYNHVAFCTDSLSLLQALNNDHPDTADTRNLLQSLTNIRLDLLYVPGHKDIPGNELADQHAKAAARLPDEADQSVPFRAAKTIIRREIKDAPPSHRLTKQFFADVSMKRDAEQVKTRREGTTLAQLRSGHFKGLAYYDALVDPEAATGDCKRCGSGEVDDVKHWLTSYLQTAVARQRIFGNHRTDIAKLANSSARIIELAGCTLSRE